MAGRNVRGPGALLFGLRRVDLRTGGPVSVRSVLIGQSASKASLWLVKRLAGPYQRREREQIDALAPQLDAIRRDHRDDKQAEQRATMDLFAAHRIRPGGPCLVYLAAGLVSQLSFLWSPRRQSVPDLLAGVVVVRERR